MDQDLKHDQYQDLTSVPGMVSHSGHEIIIGIRIWINIWGRIRVKEKVRNTLRVWIRIGIRISDQDQNQVLD